MEQIKLMIVDDHDMVRRGLITMLNDCKDIVITGDCATSEKAYEVALSNNPDIILMDIIMPRINGIEIAREIIKENPSVKIVFLTVFDDAESIKQALQTSASGYILKNITKDKLIDSIRRVYFGETVIDPTVLHHIVNNYSRTNQSLGIDSQSQTDSQSVELTPREQEIMQYLVQGFTNKEISAFTYLAIDTVKCHLQKIFRKLNVRNRAQAIKQAQNLNLWN